MVELTPQQHKGLDLHRHLLVQAGAGSGKTRVLVERFLHVLREVPDIDLDGLVAFTFTEKAAAEMRERVRAGILERLDRSLAPDARARWEGLRNHFDAARISTMHGFCRSLLRQWAIEADVDPDFAVLDDAIGTRCREEAARRLLAEHAQTDDPASAPLARLVHRFGVRGLRDSLAELLGMRGRVAHIVTTFAGVDPDGIVARWRGDGDGWDTTPDQDRDAAVAMRDLLDLWPALVTLYDEEKSDALDFDDLELRAAGLLLDHPAIRARTAAQIRFLLVDEFQDTNATQWAIVQALCGPSTRLFCVGDPKQSIYAFRGADVAIFRQGREQGVEAPNRAEDLQAVPFADRDGATIDSTPAERAGVIELSECFRCLPAIVDLTNHWFAALMAPGPAAWDVPYAPLVSRRTGEGAEGTAEVILVPQDGNDPKADEADAVARWIRRVTDPDSPHRKRVRDGDTYRPAEPGDVAVLLRSRTRLVQFEDALRRQAVPFRVTGGVGFYQAQEVVDAWNLLAVLQEPEDDLALAGVLRSPFANLSDDGLLAVADHPEGYGLWGRLRRAADSEESGPHRDALARAWERLDRWRRAADRIPTAALVARALDDSGAWAAYAVGERGPQRVANLQKLLQILRDLETSRPLLLSEVVEELGIRVAQTHREGQAVVGPADGAVTVMTIHGAKGLEFRIVCVVDLDRGFHPGTTGRLLVDEEVGFGLMVQVDVRGRFRAVPSSGRKRIVERVQARAIAEEKRLLYVAITRARDHLLLSAVDQAHGGRSFRDWLREDLAGLHVELSEDALVLKGPTGTSRLVLHTDPAAIHPDDPATADPADVSDRALALLDAPPHPAPPLPPALARALGRPAPRPAVDRLRPTALATFDECAHRFALAELYGIPEWTLLDKVDGAQAEAMRREARRAETLGRLVHRLFESLPHAGQGGEKALIEPLCREEQVDPRDFGEALHKVLARVREAPALWNELTDPRGRAEFPIALDLGPCVVEGVIDRLQQAGDDHPEVVDFKTMRVRRDADAPALVDRYRLQLQAYALGVARSAGVPVEAVRARLVFTDRPQAPGDIRTATAEQAVRATVHRIHESLSKGDFPYRDDGGDRVKACGRCGFWQHRVCGVRHG